MLEKYADKIDAELKNSGGIISAELLKEMIDLHAPKNAQMVLNYERYKASKQGVPIFSRTFPVSGEKINNLLGDDFFSEIVDTKVGYMFGIPVLSQIDKSSISESEYKNAVDTIQRFRKVNSLDDLNGEVCKFAAMCGYDAGLAYIDKEGIERVMRVNPWEAIIISRLEISEPDYAIRYFVNWEDKLQVEFYTDTERYTFVGKNNSTEGLTLVEEQNRLHMFDYCPMWGIPNNAELQGDADKVLTLIDAYDRTMSDMNSEIEQFRLAYMLFIGYAPDDATIERMKKTGALHIPTADSNEDIRFLTKTIDATAIDSHLDRLEANITRFAKHVNFTDAFGGGQVTAPAMKYKLFMLETKSKYFERKHDAATNYMFKVIASAWEKKRVKLDWTTLENKYTRNVPVNILDEANSAQALSGLVSNRTRLSQLSFINDVDEELNQIEIEKEEIGGVNLDEFVNPDGSPMTAEQIAAKKAG
jgi:SPP1 family phage portal protein